MTCSCCFCSKDDKQHSAFMPNEVYIAWQKHTITNKHNFSDKCFCMYLQKSSESEGFYSN